MTATVYFTPTGAGITVDEIQQISRHLLDLIIREEGIVLRPKVPLKVHFGEEKNVTYIKPENYQGIIDYLHDAGVASCYMETCVLYGGERYKKELHEKTAKRHGFTQLPIVFADGEHGEDFAEVEINQKHFQTFKVGRAFLDYDQMIVLSHFKGHKMAGFGGAIKQLSMGYAAKGGKLAMHLAEKPHIKNRKCTRCKKCLSRCNVDALHIGVDKNEKSWIDRDRCVGCGACVAICPQEAVSFITVRSVAKFLGIGNPFIEKLVEGAYAAQKDQRNIYISFATSITAGCDCEGKKMKPIMADMGVFASLDPVAIDKACCDMAKARGKRFKGQNAFQYAEKIGLGSCEYTLREVDYLGTAAAVKESA